MSDFLTAAEQAAYGVYAIYKDGVKVYDTGAIPGLTTLVKTAAPTTVNGDVWDETATAGGRGGNATQLNGTTQYMTLPASIAQRLITSQTGTWLRIAKRNDSVANLPLLNGGYELNGFCTNGGNFANSFTFSNSLHNGFFTSNEYVSFIMGNNAASLKGVSVGPLSAAQIDGQWHVTGFQVDIGNSRCGVIYDNLISYTDRNGTPVSFSAADLPAIGVANAFGIGAYFQGVTAGASPGYFCPYTEDYWVFSDVVLTAVQIAALTKLIHGRNGSKVYWGDRLTKVSRRARTSIVPILQIGDSNMIRSEVDAVGPGREQGYTLTIDHLIRGMTGQRLIGRHMGASSPINVDYIDGVYSNLLGSSGGNPLNSADPWPVGLYAYDLTEYNRLGPGYNGGFSMDGCYQASGSVLNTTAVGHFANASDADWPLDAGGTIVYKIRRATFNGGSGTYNLQARKTSGNVLIAGNVPYSTNTGADTFTTDDTITIGSNLAANYGEIRVTLGVATGPVAFGPATILNASRNSGFTTGVIWAYGGQPTSAFMLAWISLLATSVGEGSPSPFTRLSNIISCIIAHVGTTADPTMLIQICEGQNDLNDTNTNSYTYNGVTFTFDGATTYPSKTRLGTQRNWQALVDLFRAVWQGLGFNRANLYFEFGPYHQVGDPTGTGAVAVYIMDNQLQRAAFAVCDGDTTYQTCYVIDGPECVSYATMNAASGYDGGGPAHLTLAGYRLLGTSAGAAMAQWSGAGKGLTALRKLLLGV